MRLIIEGDDVFSSNGRMHPNAIQGILNAIALMRIPALFTLNEAETAQDHYDLRKRAKQQGLSVSTESAAVSHITSLELNNINYK